MPYIQEIITQEGPYKYQQEETLDFCSSMMDVESDRKYRLLFNQVKKATGIQVRNLAFPLDQPMSHELCTMSTGQRQQIYEVASKDLIAKLLDKTKIDFEVHNLVTVSCTGYQTPGLDFDLIKAFNLKDNLFRYNIGAMGCYAGITGLRLASCLPGNTLLLCLEICSIHFQSELNFGFLTSNSLFADGAALVKINSSNDPSSTSLRLLDFHSRQIPDSVDKMSWKLRDKGFEMGLSAEVPELIYKNIKQALVTWLASNKLKIEDITDWVIHPGSLSILHAVQRALNLPDEDLLPSLEVLKNFGNMSSGTVFFILQQVLQKYKNVSPSSKIVMMAFGPGLSVELALLEAK